LNIPSEQNLPEPNSPPPLVAIGAVKAMASAGSP